MSFQVLRTAAVTLILASSVFCAPGHAARDLRETDCDNLDISLEPAADFSDIKCKSSAGTRGGTSTAIVDSEFIDAHDALSFIVVFHDRAGSNTYLRQIDSRLLFGRTMDFDIKDSWSKTTFMIRGFSVRTFFGKLDSSTDQVPCFSFVRYIQRVPQTSGYRHMIGGVYCELVPSDQPVTRARIEQMTGKIRGDML